MDDHYRASAEYIDMMIAPWWESAAPLLAGALHGLDAASGPIVDAGAGSGRALRTVVEAVPGAEVLAVEPSPGMRAALFTRVLADERLRTRVTVVAGGLPGARLPAPLGALVAMNVIGHLPPAHRAGFWALAAERLAPAGRVVLNLSPPFEPVAVPLSPMADVRVGRARYEGWARAQPAGRDRLVWEMTYRVTGADGAVTESAVSYEWFTLGPDALAAEVAGHGLAAVPHGPADAGFFVVTREGRR